MTNREKSYHQCLGDLLLGLLFTCYGTILGWIVLVPLLDEETPLKSIVPSPADAITTGVFGVSALALSLFVLWLLIRCGIVRGHSVRS
ncbi:hypothetical protein RvY_13998 [Ramazzottius varieornatus]|uniref:Uncharacterized protein n=1 Tax=Ramazzottius varieornatus TaxID=947166 RepID=A0A1D1VPV0_RAMVA|nr:hypothetical protein RvY_13998 [Ramazzottius varieornatus]